LDTSTHQLKELQQQLQHTQQQLTQLQQQQKESQQSAKSHAASTATATKATASATAAVMSRTPSASSLLPLPPFSSKPHAAGAASSADAPKTATATVQTQTAATMQGQSRALPRQATDSGVQTHADDHDDDDVFPRGHRTFPSLSQRTQHTRSHAKGVLALSATSTAGAGAGAGAGVATHPVVSSASSPLSLESLSATNTILTTELAHLRAAHHSLQTAMKAVSPSGLDELHHQLRTDGCTQLSLSSHFSHTTHNQTSHSHIV
jgi:hypothetical protein